jgi:putative ABC transport system permease protein
LVLLIILLIVSNTMLMSARERYREYATLKAIGFDARFIAATILGESVLIASFGGLLGMLATFPLARAFEVLSGGLVPVVSVGGATVAWQMAMSLLVGVAAGAFPSWMVARRRVVESLRDIG